MPNNSCFVPTRWQRLKSKNQITYKVLDFLRENCLYGLQSFNSEKYIVERRDCPRVEASHPVLFLAGTYLGPKVAWTLDLSLGGARIESSSGLTPGDRFWMQIAIDHQTIKCRGKAVYVSGLENGSLKAGIEFEDLSEHDKLFLRQYISYIMEQRA